MSKFSYQVIEDNGGGLTLAVMDEQDKVVYLHSGYEYHTEPGQLLADIESLKTGDNPATDWEGNEDDPQGMYDNITSYEYGWKIVSDNDGIYPERMGAAARHEFGITD